MSRECKKTHKRVSGECVPNNVVNKRLYASIKKKISKRVKRKGQRWGAYTSGNLVQEYKRKGGKYRGRKVSFIRKNKSKSKRRSKRRRSKKRSKKRSKRRSKKRRSKRRSKKRVSKRRSKKRKNRMNNMSVRYLDIDYYSRSDCHYCKESNYLFKKDGIMNEINVIKDKGLPEGINGYPYFYSNKTGKGFIGYPGSVENLISNLS